MGYAPEAGKQNVGDQSFALLRTLPYARDYGAKPQTFRLATKKCVRGRTRSLLVERTPRLRAAPAVANLAFSRRQQLQPESVDLVHQIGDMRERLDRSLSGDVYVALEFALDVWSVEVAPGELKLVVLDLAVNARDAMPEGGNITIKANNVTLANDDLAGDFFRLAIVDMGTGISRDFLDRVFEPFFTTKDIGKGPGLGLAQVRGFAT